MSAVTITIAELMQAGEVKLKTGPFGTQLKASEYVEHGTPVINVRNVGFGNLRPEKLEYLPDHTAERLREHKIAKGDIVFGRKGAVERHLFVGAEQEGWIQGSDCLRLRITSKQVDPRFVSYCLLTSHHAQWIQAQASHGATMASLNQDILGRIEIPRIAFDMQRHIAGILSAYDDLIENNTRRIAILEDMARRLFEEWFVAGNVPAGQPALATTAMPISEAFAIVGGGTPSKTETIYWDDGTVDWYTPTDLTRAKSAFLDRSKDRITEIGLAKSGAQRFPARSIMMTSRATLGVFAINTGPATTNQGFITCIPNAEAPLYWLFHWLKSNMERFEGIASGSTFKEITKGNFKKLEIELPSRASVQAYESLVAPKMEMVLSLLRANTNLRTTRDLLLPKLISGEIDVCTAGEEPEAAAA